MTRNAVSRELFDILERGYDNFTKVKVCKYGSDPLKTYLPNSDIDITLVPVVASDSTSGAAALNFYTELDAISKMLQNQSE